MIVRNLAYGTTLASNDLLAKPHFKQLPKRNLRITVAKPTWLSATSAEDALNPNEHLPLKAESGSITIELDHLDLGRFVWIKNQL